MSTALRIRVYWEDTDAFGVVYHANYLRWLERARTEWLRQLGFGQERLLSEAGVGFTVAELDIRYLRPARLDDELLVTTQATAVGKASIKFKQEIQYAQPASPVLTTAVLRVGCIQASSFRPQRMPEAIENAIVKELAHVG